MANGRNDPKHENSTFANRGTKDLSVGAALRLPRPMIRKTPRKPIRVFLQDGSADLDNEHGNWPLGNQQMAAALKFAKYDYRFEYGDGGHNGKHGGSILPDSLQRLWREEK
jgi:hypothetical protein